MSIWEWVNSPAAITIAAAIALFLINLLYSRKPLWEAWEGTIIAAVKYAEKAIPDDAANTGVRRLNEALQYVVRVYEEARGVAPTEKQKQEIKEGIQIVHATLEAADILGGKDDADTRDS